MESWSYSCEAKGPFFTDEMDLPVDAFARSRKAHLSWDLKPSTDFEAIEKMEFMDFAFADMNKKPFYGNPSLAMFGNDSAKGVVCPTRMFTSSSYYGEEESGSLMESKCNSQESPLIDLKLGRLTDRTDAQDGIFSKEASVVSSIRPALMAKKAQKTSSYSHIPRCQVYGCNKDLSSSKDYHKRHKVCEAHSKTAKVLVNGIEQRFCQQCSRFHLLAEFDDGKRSCRKRLAGHNERRRKLHFNTLSGKPSKLLQSYQGTKFLGSSILKKTPFVIPNIFEGDYLNPERYEHGYQCQQVKSEETPIYSPQSAIPITNGQLIPKSFLHMHGIGEQYVPGTFSSAAEAFNAPNAAVGSTVKELSGISRSDCALSLLSAQSPDSSSFTTGNQTNRPLVNQAGHAHHSSGESAVLGSLEKANGFYSYGMNPMGVGQAGPIVVSDAGHTVSFEVQTDGYFQDSGLSSASYCLPSGNGTTVDLHQLSTHPQRVERQRNSIQVKQENEDSALSLPRD